MYRHSLCTVINTTNAQVHAVDNNLGQPLPCCTYLEDRPTPYNNPADCAAFECHAPFSAILSAWGVFALQHTLSRVQVVSVVDRLVNVVVDLVTAC